MVLGDSDDELYAFYFNCHDLGNNMDRNCVANWACGCSSINLLPFCFGWDSVSIWVVTTGPVKITHSMALCSIAGTLSI